MIRNKIIIRRIFRYTDADDDIAEDGMTDNDDM